jgi:diaminopimelate decarboxylase
MMDVEQAIRTVVVAVGGGLPVERYGTFPPLAIEAVADRTRTRYGHQVLYPATLAISSRPPTAQQKRGGGNAGPPQD